MDISSAYSSNSLVHVIKWNANNMSAITSVPLRQILLVLLWPQTFAFWCLIQKTLRHSTILHILPDIYGSLFRWRSVSDLWSHKFMLCFEISRNFVSFVNTLCLEIWYRCKFLKERYFLIICKGVQDLRFVNGRDNNTEIILSVNFSNFL